MSAELQIMVLPPAVPDGLPQVYLDDDGIWRDTTAAQAVVLNTQSKMKRDIEAHLKPLMRRVGATPPQPVQPENVGFRDPFKTMFQDLLPIDVRQALAAAADAADANPAEPRPLLKDLSDAGSGLDSLGAVVRRAWVPRPTFRHYPAADSEAGDGDSWGTGQAGQDRLQPARKQHPAGRRVR